MSLAGRLPRPWRTLRGRIALASLAGLLAASVVFAVVGTQLVRSEAERVSRSEFDRQAKALAKLVSTRAEEAATRGEEFTFFRVENLTTLVGPGTRLYAEGLELAPGAARPYDTFPRGAAQALEYGVLERDGVQRLDFVRPDTGEITEASAAPVELGGQIVGAILLSRPSSEVAADWGALARRVALAAGAGLVVALFLVLFLTSRVARPLRAMRVATRRVARGDRRVTLRRTGTQELDALSDAFNQMVRELAQSDAASRDFLMQVTHDLRTPLTAIRGHALALSDGVVPPDDVPRSLAAISGEARRLEALVADLLDLARLDARRFRLDLADADPAEVLDRAFDALEAEAAARGVRYERDIAPMPPMLTDEARVRQIVGNLIENALRWTPVGGTVRLTGRARPGGGLIATVSDSGPGLVPGDEEVIFEPFRSLEAPDGRRGTGLGLAISRELARALGGDVRADVHGGTGGRFVLELPRAREGQEAFAATEPR
jgi:two-component system sensor histidine kinase BaeS